MYIPFTFHFAIFSFRKELTQNTQKIMNESCFLTHLLQMEKKTLHLNILYSKEIHFGIPMANDFDEWINIFKRRDEAHTEDERSGKVKERSNLY